MKKLFLLSLLFLCSTGLAAEDVSLPSSADAAFKYTSVVLDMSSLCLVFEDTKNRVEYLIILVNEHRQKKQYPDSKHRMAELCINRKEEKQKIIVIPAGSPLEKQIVALLEIFQTREQGAADKQNITFFIESLQQRDVPWKTVLSRYTHGGEKFREFLQKRLNETTKRLIEENKTRAKDDAPDSSKNRAGW